MSRRNDFKMTRDRQAYILICLCVFFLTVICSPYSPIYHYCFKEDEICYKIMAKGLLDGKMPYRDLFDHKGPLTYFIYALGYIFTRNTDTVLMLLFSVINVATYITAYKTLRLFYDEEKSLFSTMLFLTVIGFSAANILSSMSKPENVLMLPVMLSAYVFLRKHNNVNTSGQYLFSIKEMYFIGLMCGCVFMIKLNFCIYYLTFIGLYFIWILVRKQIKNLLIQGFTFLAGILTIVIPIFLFYYLNDALKPLIDTYFLFNISYSTHGDKFSLNYLGEMAKISGLVFLVVLVCGIVLYFKKQKARVQDIVLFIASLLVILFVISPSMTFAYTLIVLMPILLFGISWLSDLIINATHDYKTRFQLCTIIAVVLCINMAYQLFYIIPPDKQEKSDYGHRLEYYSQVNPDAEYMFLACICQPLCYDLTDSLPSFRVFYLPPMATENLMNEQLSAISQGLPDAIVIPFGGIHSNISDALALYANNSGYVIYAVFDAGDNSGSCLYVKADNPVLVT